MQMGIYRWALSNRKLLVSIQIGVMVLFLIALF